MNTLQWLVLFSTIGSLTLLWIIYILQNLSQRNEKTQIDEEEERLVELMGKVRVFVDSKIEQLNKKMEEVRKLVKELNEQYIALSTLSLKNVETKFEAPANTLSSGNESPDNNIITVEEKLVVNNVGNLKSTKSEQVSDYESSDENNVEKKIFEMYQNGMDPVEIAKSLKMGVGEVQLIIDLMKRQ